MAAEPVSISMVTKKDFTQDSFINDYHNNSNDIDDVENKNENIRLIPHNDEIEASLISALLNRERAYEDISDFLLPEHFYIPAHQNIFALIKQLYDRGQVVNYQTLKHLISNDDIINQAGGIEYLRDIAANPLSLTQTAQMGHIIFDLFLKRQLINLGNNIIHKAYHDNLIESPALEQIAKSEEELFRLATGHRANDSLKSFSDVVATASSTAKQAHDNKDSIIGITSGFRDIDNMLGGFHQSDLLILAGRPAMGKTALATNIAYHAANFQSSHQKGCVLFFSLEMSSEQLALRILSEQSSISSDRIRRGVLSESEFQTFTQTADRIKDLKLIIDDTPGLQTNILRQRARRTARQQGLKLIIIDYLQLLQASQARANDSRVNQISEITRDLKIIAKELNVPIIALSQLSRSLEQRDDKRPQLSDLRESGSIEQDADVVSFIYREEYYLRPPEQRENESIDKFMERTQKYHDRLEEVRNITQLIIAKQRHGPTGTVELFFNSALTRFQNYDPHH